MFKIKSIKYRCYKCHFFTAGIPNGTSAEDTKRFCPLCRSELIRCKKCFMHVSTTKTADGLLCDDCDLNLPDKISESRPPGWGY